MKFLKIIETSYENDKEETKEKQERDGKPACFLF